MDAIPCSGPALFVATDLSSWRTPRSEGYEGDAWTKGRCYRELDPDYYAWLRYKLSLAERAGGRGGLSLQALADLEARFAEIERHAILRFDREALDEAARTLDPRTYRPPKLEFIDWLEWPHLEERARGQERRAGHFYPADGDWPHFEPVPPEAVSAVRTIEQEALALGWTEIGLYQNRGRYRFPCAPGYGLVCFVVKSREIVGVAPEVITIRTPGGHELRFWNPARRGARSGAADSSDETSGASVCIP